MQFVIVSRVDIDNEYLFDVLNKLKNIGYIVPDEYYDPKFLKLNCYSNKVFIFNYYLKLNIVTDEFTYRNINRFGYVYYFNVIELSKRLNSLGKYLFKKEERLKEELNYLTVLDICERELLHRYSKDMYYGNNINYEKYLSDYSMLFSKYGLNNDKLYFKKSCEKLIKILFIKGLNECCIKAIYV